MTRRKSLDDLIAFTVEYNGNVRITIGTKDGYAEDAIISASNIAGIAEASRVAKESSDATAQQFTEVHK